MKAFVANLLVDVIGVSDRFANALLGTLLDRWTDQLVFTQGITHSRPDIRCRPDRQNTHARLHVWA